MALPSGKLLLVWQCPILCKTLWLSHFKKFHPYVCTVFAHPVLGSFYKNLFIRAYDEKISEFFRWHFHTFNPFWKKKHFYHQSVILIKSYGWNFLKWDSHKVLHKIWHCHLESFCLFDSAQFCAKLYDYLILKSFTHTSTTKNENKILFFFNWDISHLSSSAFWKKNQF